MGANARTFDSGLVPGRQVLDAFLGQMKTSHATLERVVDGLSTDVLEWQVAIGTNTIGMLLSHIAIAEAFWAAVATGRYRTDEEAESHVLTIVGNQPNDDGMPISPLGKHPDALEGKTTVFYNELIVKAFAYLINECATWDDDILFDCFEFRGGPINRAWILHHLIQHLAYHVGQIAQLKALHSKFNADQVRREPG